MKAPQFFLLASRGGPWDLVESEGEVINEVVWFDKR